MKSISSGVQQTDEIGRVIADRLRVAAEARRWTQRQVHCQANAGKSYEIISLTTVSALMRGAIPNPGIASVLAVANALGLTLDQVAGLTALPIPPSESELAARIERLEATLQTFLTRSGSDARAESARG